MELGDRDSSILNAPYMIIDYVCGGTGGVECVRMASGTELGERIGMLSHNGVQFGHKNE